MAVDKQLCLEGRYQDCSKLTINDETPYTNVAPDRRQDFARYLFGAKMDEAQVLTYISDIINTDPLATVSWTFTSMGDGAYRFYYLDIPLYDNAVTYVKQIVNGSGIVTQYGNIVYRSGILYKAIGTSFSGITPGVTTGWETSWVIILEADLKTEYLNDKIGVFRNDDISTCNYEACLLAKIEEEGEELLCSSCVDDEKFLNVIKAQFLLEAALSADWQDKAVRAEIILKEAKKKFCC